MKKFGNSAAWLLGLITPIFVCGVLAGALAPGAMAQEAGTTTRVSLDSDGNEGNEESFHPAISGDGRFVAFQSEAKNLVPADTNGVDDVFLHRISPANIVNDLVLLGNVDTAFDPTDVRAPAGVFTITATFTNTSASAINNPYFQVAQLSGENVLLNSDSDGTITGRNVGATLTADVSADGILSAGESFTTDFEIGLTTPDAFAFFVNVLGNTSE